MKKIICLNPSVTTLNMGDCIIAESAKAQLQPILAGNFVVDVSTHLPISRLFADLLADADLRFVLGTNLLRNYMGRKFRQWDIDAYSAKRLFPSILMGVGWHNDSDRLARSAVRLYQTVLKDTPFQHSVRDEYSRERLAGIGIQNVLNTGCPSMWKLTPEFCKRIPQKKARSVVYTLTDYAPEPEADKAAVALLKRHYETVYLWLQGYGDYQYASELGMLGDVTLVPPALSDYDALLERPDIEYVGTRLHGGIRALQHGKRTLILAVDERAVEKQHDYNLPVLRRAECGGLAALLEADRPTEIRIPLDTIAAWKAQFEPILR